MNIKTLQVNKNEEVENSYNIILGKNPKNESLPYLGIGNLQDTTSLIGKIRMKLSFFKDANTYYSPKFNSDLVIFIYNLISI